LRPMRGGGVKADLVARVKIGGALGYAYLGCVTVASALGAWWVWCAAWEGWTRFATVLAGLCGYGALLLVGGVLFPVPSQDEFMVRVVLSDQVVELPCSTYEVAFRVAMHAVMLGYERGGVWLDVSITPDEPEKVK
jgi:hypothetical protein